MNDTGSNILSLFDADMPYLGNLQGYGGWLGLATISYANGAANIYPVILVQVQLVRGDNSAWSDWIEERAIVQPLRPGVSRLSGVGIRGVLYIGTAPGNHFLAVATTKGGLTSLL
jgi:hypothetical protein